VVRVDPVQGERFETEVHHPAHGLGGIATPPELNTDPKSQLGFGVFVIDVTQADGPLQPPIVAAQHP
jgi:hypothetical protein